jgi:hypothetical protein
MTPQEVFDTSLNHIRKQGKPATNRLGECAYTTHNGLHCAAWPFLTPEAQADPDVQGDWGVAVADGFATADGVLHTTLIRSMQHIHDSAAQEADFMAFYERGMAELALRYGLVYNPPK